MNGYTGLICWIDLSNLTVREEKLPDIIYEKVIGGVGLAALILHEHIPAGADPLGPDNILAFTAGPLSGSMALFSGRWMAAAKSPLTSTWGDANCGGTLAPAIKQCGYDGIFIKGISKDPVYIHIDPTGVKIKSAHHLWGLDCVETEEKLEIELQSKKKPAIASIGPAGEKLSLISGIVNDKGRIAARSGLGAVMGSKKLKALVLSGNKSVDVVDKQRIKQLNIQFAPYTKSKLMLPNAKPLLWAGILMRALPIQMALDGLMSIPIFKQYGTSSYNQFAVELGDAPVKNWAGSDKDFQQNMSNGVSPDESARREIRKYHCHACPLGCGGIFSYRDGETHKPEYETTNSFGAMLLNNDFPAIIEINDLVNRAGLDSISAGATIAFAFECFEKGWITLDDTDGLELNWGDSRAILSLLKKMIAREGIGNILADGVAAASNHIGNGSHAAAIHAGGQELSYHDTRLDPGYALHMSVDPTPGRHTTGSQMYYEMYRLWKVNSAYPKVPLFYSKASKYSNGFEKAKAAVGNSEWTWLYSAAGLCMFGANLGVDRMPVFDWLNAATGWQKSAEDYLEIGRRIQTIRQSFNIKHGIRPIDNIIHPRALGEPPQRQGANRGRKVNISPAIHEYWQSIGWDENTGIPTQTTLDELDIPDLFALVSVDGDNDG